MVALPAGQGSFKDEVTSAQTRQHISDFNVKIAANGCGLLRENLLRNSEASKIQINLHKNRVEYKSVEKSVACQTFPHSFMTWSAAYELFT